MTKVKTGIAGLDDITLGGFQREKLHLIEGAPGAGKTTIALQFLLEGCARGEKCLHMTLSETAHELRAIADAHGWELPDNLRISELVPPDNLLDENQQQSLLYASDLELGEVTKRIFAEVAEFNPDRIVVDGMSEIRLLAQNPLRYRRQILALKHYFAKLKKTVIFLDGLTLEGQHQTIHSIAHAVIRLEEMAPNYGRERRRLRIIKYRGQAFRGGYHDFVVDEGGVRVFPRLVAAEHHSDFERTRLQTSNSRLDELLGGGLERGSSALILGPAGTGKSLLALTFISAAIQRGEKAAIFMFDEELGLFIGRAMNLGFDVQAMSDAGNLVIDQIDAAELTPGEFTQRVRDRVEHNDVGTVVIDSLNGYQAAMPEEHWLLLHMHELLQYLNRRGISTFLTIAQHGLVGNMESPVDVTYLADTVILLRYFEAHGHVRRAISVVKKRTGPHEKTIREYAIGTDGFVLGEPLVQFHGVLRGVPTYVGQQGAGAVETTADFAG